MCYIALVGQKLTVIAWLWARTVKSPNPAFRQVDVPLAATFMLANKPGKEAWVQPVIEDGGYRFTVRVGKPKDAAAAKAGTKLARGANFGCVMSGTPIAGDYIKAEGKAGRMGARLMAIAAEGERGRVYLSPTPEHEAAAKKAKPEWKPEVELTGKCGDQLPLYGMTAFADIFTSRQSVLLTTFSDLLPEVVGRVRHDGPAKIFGSDAKPLREGGAGVNAYGEAVTVLLTFVLSKLTESHTMLCTWSSAPKNELVVSTFRRQALPMTWDFAEANPFADSSGSIEKIKDAVARVVDMSLSGASEGSASQADAATQSVSQNKVVSTDPPYYDNVQYADLSDFFYGWVRKPLRGVFPELLGTMAVPKAEELVASPYRHNSKEEAEAFFLEGMTNAMHRLAEQAHTAFPVTIYYAFKQTENEDDLERPARAGKHFLMLLFEPDLRLAAHGQHGQSEKGAALA